ncbi:VOC family protein [Halobellus sp. GM3]|uniref:VOC family protein n=1 Tax=Halobellus sp. GM3 TaxID=3458410 RepID=UPI00403E27E3
MAVATLGHVELLCPDLEASRDHFHDVLGLEEEFREDGRIYMRAWGDWEAYTLILTESEAPGIGHVALQTETDDDLDEYASRIEDSGYEIEWRSEGSEPHHGRSIRFDSPAGFEFELFHEIDRVEIDDEEKSGLKNQPQKRVDRGAEARRIDHINFFVPNVEEATAWCEDVLDFSLREEIVDEDDGKIATWISVSPLVHEIAFVKAPERQLNHLAYYLPSQGDLYRSADVLRDQQVQLTGGPGKHGVSQAHYLYHLEPSGHQIELFAGGYSILDPNWEPVTWYPDEMQDGLFWWGKEVTYDPEEGQAAPPE